MPATPRADGRPVLLANGFMPFEVSLNRLAAAYRDQGFEPYVVPYSHADMVDARQYARSIADLIGEIYRDTGRRVDVVGISMGGVCALHAVKHLGAEPMVRTVVLAGSPVNGTPLSYLAAWSHVFSRTGRQLTFGSDFLHDVHDGPLPERVRFVTLGGFLDFICPPAVTVLSGAENYFHFFGHHDLMFSPWLHRLIGEKLLQTE
ncbi:lipase family alpha/beta hydrolase [Patescibacteria group bacterium]